MHHSLRSFLGKVFLSSLTFCLFSCTQSVDPLFVEDGIKPSTAPLLDVKELSQKYSKQIKGKFIGRRLSPNELKEKINEEFTSMTVGNGIVTPDLNIVGSMEVSSDGSLILSPWLTRIKVADYSSLYYRILSANRVRSGNLNLVNTNFHYLGMKIWYDSENGYIVNSSSRSFVYSFTYFDHLRVGGLDIPFGNAVSQQNWDVVEGGVYQEYFMLKGVVEAFDIGTYTTNWIYVMS